MVKNYKLVKKLEGLSDFQKLWISRSKIPTPCGDLPKTEKRIPISHGIYNCPAHGDFYGSVWEVNGKIQNPVCPICESEEKTKKIQKEYEKQQKELEKLKKEQKLAELASKEIKAPRKYEGVSLKSFETFENPHRIKVLNSAIDLLSKAESGFTFIFTGSEGIGKSTLGVAMGNELLRKGKTVAYHTERWLSEELDSVSNVRFDSKTKAQLRDELMSVDCLILDEIGTGDWKDSHTAFLDGLLTARIDDRKINILLGNVNREAFKSRFRRAFYLRAKATGCFFDIPDGENMHGRIKK